MSDSPITAPAPDWLGTAQSAGWLRPLDTAFARFIARVAPAASEPCVLAAALLAHAESQGHSCLPLAWLANGAALAEALGWPEAALASFNSLQASAEAHWPTTASAWAETLTPCEAIGTADTGITPETPLVLHGHRLYLARYWQFEQTVLRSLQARCALATTGNEVNTSEARDWIAQLFATPRPEGPNPWQTAACALALKPGVTLITGGPGTGKTYTAARLLALKLLMAGSGPQPRIALAAPTGKAAARLKQSIGDAVSQLQLVDPEQTAALVSRFQAVGPARTLHALLGARTGTRQLRHHAQNPLPVDLLIVDEASMIHLEMMAALLSALPTTSQLVLLGDKDQLASVEAGAVLGDLCRHAEQGRYTAATAQWLQALTGHAPPATLLDNTGPQLAQHTVMLRDSQRFGGLIGQLASSVQRGDADAALRTLATAPAAGTTHELQALHSNSPSAVLALALPPKAAPAPSAAAAPNWSTFVTALRKRPMADEAASHEAWVRQVLQAFDEFRVLCAVREGPWGVADLNRAIENHLVQHGGLVKRGAWYEGRPVMVTRNNADQHLFNGDIGIVLRAPPSAANGERPLKAWFASGGELRAVSVSQLAHVETAFAMTVHKSQGSEFAHTVLVLPPDSPRVLTRELVYTGITRAKTAFSLVCTSPETLATAINRVTQRASGLGDAIESL